MVFGPASELGVSLFEDTPPIELTPGRSLEEVEIVIRAVYRQVLGNAYVMESERATVPESKLKQGELSVREFVRAVAKSDLYRSRFFETSPRYRFIELNFKHLLGRAPDDLEEMRKHSTILDTEGFEAEIDSYLDSDEYQSAYGENIVPYYRGYKTQPGQDMVGFTHFFALARGASSSDFKGSLAGKAPVLNKYVIQQLPIPVIPLLEVLPAMVGHSKNPPTPLALVWVQVPEMMAKSTASRSPVIAHLEKLTASLNTDGATKCIWFPITSSLKSINGFTNKAE